MIILGVMSGSSLDGLDIAAYNINQDTEDSNPIIDRLAGVTVKYNHIRTMLERASDRSSLKEILVLEYDYSKWVADQIIAQIAVMKIKPDYLSVHGHTVTHLPDRHMTFQIGHGGIIASLTDIPTVTDFRRGDMALKGKGTPLTPVLDMLEYNQYGLVINLGGICNVSYGLDGKRYGYDLFPCNQVFNHFAKKYGRDYDVDGKLAQEGKMDEALYKSLITHRLLIDQKPQAIDNSWIRHKFIPEIEYYNSSDKDKLYTFTCAVAKVIATHAEKLGVETVFITGGGIHNDFLKAQITYQLGEKKLIVPNAAETDFKECRLMALLAYYRVTGRDNILATVTGASRNSIGGAVYL